MISFHNIRHLFEFALEDDTVEMPITYYTPGKLDL